MLKISKLLTIFALLLLTVASQAQISRSAGTTVSSSRSSSSTGNRTNNFQGDTNQNPGGDTDTLPKGIIYETNIVPDSTLINSVNIFHFAPLSIKIIDHWHPLLNPKGLQLNDKIHSFNDDYYLNTGNVGQACYSLMPKLLPQTDFR